MIIALENILKIKVIYVIILFLIFFLQLSILFYLNAIAENTESILLNFSFISIICLIILKAPYKNNIPKNINSISVNLPNKIQALLLLFSFFLIYITNHKYDIFNYVIKGNIKEFREILLTEYFPFELRLIGYISVISTILYLNYERYSKGINIVVLIPISISLLSALSIGGRGFMILNLSSLYFYFLVKNKKLINFLYFFISGVFLFSFVDFIRNNYFSIGDVLSNLIFYIVAPIFGLQFLIENFDTFQNVCGFPKILSFIFDCNINLDSITYDINEFYTITNVYGFLGNIFIFKYIVPVLFILIFFIISIRLIFFNILNNNNFGINFYLMSIFTLFSFYMNVFLFNGFIFSLFFLVTIVFPVIKLIKSLIFFYNYRKNL